MVKLETDQGLRFDTRSADLVPKNHNLAILWYLEFLSISLIWHIYEKFDLSSNFMFGNLAPIYLVKALTQALLSQVSLPSSQLILSHGSNPCLTKTTQFKVLLCKCQKCIFSVGHCQSIERRCLLSNFHLFGAKNDLLLVVRALFSFFFLTEKAKVILFVPK